MMKKRGQAAMEFLMTYGWAIIVVLAAIGALAYFGVLSPSNLLPERTTFQAPIPSVDNAVILQSGIVTLAFRNNVGSSINIVNVSEADGDCVLADIGDISVGTATVFTDISNDLVQNGDAFRMQIDCGGLVSGERFKSDITFFYTNGDSGLTRPLAGSVEGKVI